MSTNLLHFPRWAEILRNLRLPEKVKKSYEITLRWYLGWCRRQGLGCSVDSARTFVDWAQQDKGANGWQVEQWKKAIQWYFVQRRQQVMPESSSSEASEKVSKASSGQDSTLTGGTNYSDNGEERPVALSTDEARVLDLMRRRGMALRTERSYICWYRDFLRQSGLNSGAQMDAANLKSYLSYLAMERAVASSTQKVALNALVFVAREVFEIEIGDISDFCQAKNRKRIPVVMGKAETRQFFEQLSDEKFRPQSTPLIQGF